MYWRETDAFSALVFLRQAPGVVVEIELWRGDGCYRP